ncbi:MAG: Crp/Fnr family transcriptional regulator [Gammaproteobacteria bacterium]|nr:Crp/Fnr family transcriptional regulator [Gammaproteobacteria bacterium]
MENIAHLNNSSFLLRLSEHERSDLLKLGKKLHIRRNEIIFHAGGDSDFAYILLDGRVKIYQIASYGKEVILWFCFPGELFGLSEIFNGELREAHAEACRDLNVLAIPYTELRAFLTQHPGAAMHIIDMLAGRVRILSNSMLNLVADDVSSRVMKLLYRLAKCYGQPQGDAIRLPMHLTHQELADMIGTSRQTVTVVLGDLRRKGTIEIKNHMISILQPDRMKPSDGEANHVHFEQTASMVGIAI